MMPMRARDRPLGLANKVKWRRIPTAPDASAALYCSRRSSRASRGNVAPAPALRRSAVRVLWRDERAILLSRHECAYAREIHGCACGGFWKAGKSVSCGSVRLLKSALLQPLTLGRVNLLLRSELAAPTSHFCG